MSMSLAALGWLFTVGVLVHNAEEALWLPAWSARAIRWYRPVPAPVFRFAAAVLSLAFLALTLVATLSPAGSVAAYLMAGYALAMLLTVLVPQAQATVAWRRYMPGTATAVFLNLPLGLWYLRQALAQRFIKPQVFRWAGPLVVAGLLVAMPMLFALGRAARRIKP